MPDKNSTEVTPTNTKAKTITLVVLLMWVLAVFVITILKFAKIW